MGRRAGLLVTTVGSAGGTGRGAGMRAQPPAGRQAAGHRLCCPLCPPRQHTAAPRLAQRTWPCGANGPGRICFGRPSGQCGTREGGTAGAARGKGGRIRGAGEQPRRGSHPTIQATRSASAACPGWTAAQRLPQRCHGGGRPAPPGRRGATSGPAPRAPLITFRGAAERAQAAASLPSSSPSRRAQQHRSVGHGLSRGELQLHRNTPLKSSRGVGGCGAGATAAAAADPTEGGPREARGLPARLWWTWQ